jgi:preprotein translocase subunit YajC
MMPVLSIVLQAAQRDPYATLRLFIPMIGFFLIFYFLILRPQKKMQQQHQSLLAALKKGDEVITAGGIVGIVVHLTDDRVTIRTAENTRLVVVRGKIDRVVTAPVAVTEG